MPDKGRYYDYIITTFGYIYLATIKSKYPVTTGMCIITTKHVHQHIDGFNEEAIYGEDVDYGLRAVASGAKYLTCYRTLILTSIRRADAIGRIKLLRTWLDWRKTMQKTGPITDKNSYDYKFGHFK
jgi:hypothetical protein